MTPQDIEQRLIAGGLRPTRQRMAIATALFSGPDRHVSPEHLYRELTATGARISLATIYNTLNHFRALGLLQEVSIGTGVSCFDTNVTPHCHLYNEDTGQLTDADPSALGVDLTHLQLPGDTTLARIDLVIRVRNT